MINRYASYDSYGLRHLPSHLIRSRRWKSLENTLTDFDFLHIKVKMIGPRQLVSDFDAAFAHGYSSDDLHLLRETLLLSSHILAKEAEQLPTQIIGRLMVNPSSTLVQSLQDQIFERITVPWLRPIIPLPGPQGSLLYTLTGHSEPVNCLVMTSDERQVISGSADCLIKIWDLEKRSEMFTLEGHQSSITALALSSNDQVLISGDAYGTLKIWNLTEQQEVASLIGHEGQIEALLITQDGYCISGSSDCTVRIWNIEAREVIHVLRSRKAVKYLRTPSYPGKPSARNWRSLKEHYYESGHGSMDLFPVTALSLNSVGTQLILAVQWPIFRGSLDESRPDAIEFWDIEKGDRLFVRKARSTGVGALAAARDDHLVFASGQDQDQLICMNVPDNTETWAVRNPSSINDIAISLDNKFVICGCEDSTITIWHLEDGARIASLGGHGDSVRAVAVSADVRRIASASTDRTIRVWNLRELTLSSELESSSSEIVCMHSVHQSNRMISVSRDGVVKTWDIESASVIDSFEARTRVQNASVTSDGKWIVLEGKALSVWNLETGERVHTLTEEALFSASVHSLAARSRKIAACGPDALQRVFLQVWDLETGEKIYATRVGVVKQLALTPDGSQVLYTMRQDSKEYLVLQPLLSGLPRRILDQRKSSWTDSDSFRQVVVTPDGAAAVVVTSDGYIDEWDLSTGTRRMQTRGMPAEVRLLATSTNGKILLYRVKNYLHVDNLANPRKTFNLQGHAAPVISAAVVHGGERAVSIGGDNQLKIWDLENRSILATYVEEGPLNQCSIAPNGTIVIASTRSRKIRFLRLENVEALSVTSIEQRGKAIGHSLDWTSREHQSVVL